MSPSRRAFLLASVAGVGLNAQRRRTGSLRSFDSRIRPVLASLSLEQKVGQMTQPDQMFLKSLDDIEKYHVGSVLSGGDSDPKSGNDLVSWTDMYDRCQERALRAPARIPIVYGVDAVHGHNNVIGATVFPHNIGLGCTRNAKLVEQASRITAEEVRATGINWAFAPCVAVPQDVRWGRTYEGYSSSAAIVKELGAAATMGLQRGRLDDPLAVLACAKHYVGDGGTTFGTGTLKSPRSQERWPFDQGDMRVDEATLRSVHLQSYITAIAAGVGSIMPSYSSWNGEKCSGSHRLLTEILKNELGFDGFLISDYNALDQLPGDRAAQIERSINAGMDMAMVPERYAEYHTTLVELVRQGRVPMSRIDDAVTRILRAKFAMGLMDAKRNHLADRSLHRTFGSAEHRAVARQCVRESVVVLKNDGHVLPLSKSGSLAVAGAAADDIGIQCGGWTITWQGKAGAVTTGGTTILAAMRQAAPSVTFSADGSATDGAKTAVVVIGEKPYAEMMGDRSNLDLAAGDVELVKRVKATGAAVVVVLLSGRPVALDKIMDSANAIVAAWLPGTEGAGVADILFGAHKATGKLSHNWPNSPYQLGHGLAV